MLTDARYTNDIVLKKEAYQELLTSIKHYPIIDIDFMEEFDRDDRTNLPIWENYTEDFPCIKVTYGDPQTIKGNVIFCSEFRHKIHELKERIEGLKGEASKQEIYLDRLKKIYDDNYKTLILLEKELQAYMLNQEQVSNQEAQALRDLLNNERTPGLIQLLSNVAHMAPHAANEFERFAENTITEINFTQSIFEIKGTSWKLVTLKTADSNNYGYIPVPSNEIDLSTDIYYKKDDSGNWQIVSSSSSEDAPTYYFQRVEITSDTFLNKLNENISIKLYHDYDNIRLNVALPIYRMAYAKYIEAGLANHLATTQQESQIQEFYTMAVNFINLLEAYENNWGYRTDPDNFNSIEVGSQFRIIETTITDYLENIFKNSLKSKIENTAIAYNKNYDGTGLTANDTNIHPLSQIQADIIKAEELIAAYNESINDIAAGTHVINTNFNENATLAKYTNWPVTPSTSENQGQDKRMFGYKYIKVGSNIHFKNTYCYAAYPYSLFGRDEEMTVFEAENNAAANQKSGTFRITLNNHIYEVPIKGFTQEASNQDIYITTLFDPNDPDNASKNKTINFQGNVAGAGNIVTNNGNIYASSGAVGAATYLAVRGFPVNNETGASSNTYAPDNTAGFWYDGRTAYNLIRTWDITNDQDIAGLGTYQLVLTNGGSTTNAGIINNNGTIEFHTGIPLTGKTNGNNWADIKVKNITTTGDILPNANISKDLGSIDSENNANDKRWRTLYIKDINTTGNIIPNGTTNGTINTGGDLGANDHRWANIYGYTGNFINLTVNGHVINTDNLNKITNGGNHGVFWRGGDSSTTPSTPPNWSNILETDNGGYLVLRNNTTNFIKGSNKLSSDDHTYFGGIYFGASNGSTAAKKSLSRILTYLNKDSGVSTFVLSCYKNEAESTNATSFTMVYDQSLDVENPSQTSYDSYIRRGNFNGALKATKVFNAVFNDYAEYRTTINLDPGRVVIDNDDGSLACATQRLQPGAQVISDTFGQSMGETDNAKTPLAVAGRVLVYTYQPRENYHAGMAVCSAPGGTIDIMTREEIREYPDCIIGIVSEIPQYETWGTDNVKVDGRIWIKVK